MGGLGITRLGAFAAACLALAACGSVPERPDTDATTFVSLNPCLDAILVEVAEPVQVLALSHYSRDPAASSMDVTRAKQFGVTGGTAEEVIALQPDVVLASSFIDPATKSALEQAGMRVETFGSPASVAESLTQIREVADLTGQQAAGESLALRIARQPSLPAMDHISALLWQPGEIVAGNASLVAEHLRWAGFSSYAEEHGLGQADRVTLEQIVARPPDLLLVAGDSPGQEHPILRQSDRTRVEPFDSSLFYCAGPSITRARARLREIRGQVTS